MLATPSSISPPVKGQILITGSLDEHLQLGDGGKKKKEKTTQRDRGMERQIEGESPPERRCREVGKSDWSSQR